MSACCHEQVKPDQKKAGKKADSKKLCKPCREQLLQRRALGPVEQTEVPPIVYDVLRSPGRPLDGETRGFMESRLGHDFGRVRVHTDSRAAESAKAINARAYASGADIVFGSAMFAPTTIRGTQLLAHELTHVIQQRNYRTSRNLQVADHKETAEKEADAISSKIFSVGLPLQINQTYIPSSIIFRQQAARNLKSPPAPTPKPRPPYLKLVPDEGTKKLLKKGGKEGTKKLLKKGGKEIGKKVAWRYIKKAIVLRFGAIGVTALAFMVGDGPSPIGDSVAIVMALKTIYTIYEIWDVLLIEASKLQEEEQSQESPQQKLEPEEKKKDDCRKDRFALKCDFLTRDEVVYSFLQGEGVNKSINECHIMSKEEFSVDACEGELGISWHCSLIGDSREVSVFSCRCCNGMDGKWSRIWKGEHWGLPQDK